MTETLKRLNPSLHQCIAYHFISLFREEDLEDPKLKEAWDYWVGQI